MWLEGLTARFHFKDDHTPFFSSQDAIKGSTFDLYAIFDDATKNKKDE